MKRCLPRPSYTESWRNGRHPSSCVGDAQTYAPDCPGESPQRYSHDPWYSYELVFSSRAAWEETVVPSTIRLVLPATNQRESKPRRIRGEIQERRSRGARGYQSRSAGEEERYP